MEVSTDGQDNAEIAEGSSPSEGSEDKQEEASEEQAGSDAPSSADTESAHGEDKGEAQTPLHKDPEFQTTIERKNRARLAAEKLEAEVKELLEQKNKLLSEVAQDRSAKAFESLKEELGDEGEKKIMALVEIKAGTTMSQSIPSFKNQAGVQDFSTDDIEAISDARSQMANMSKNPEEFPDLERLTPLMSEYIDEVEKS